MPVEDHAVHEKVKIGKDHRYGCFNFDGRKQTVVSLMSGNSWPYRMSNECRYDMSLTDPNCTGCKHRGSGEDYDRMVREIGK